MLDEYLNIQSVLKENAAFKLILCPLKHNVGAHSALPFVDSD